MEEVIFRGVQLLEPKLDLAHSKYQRLITLLIKALSFIVLLVHDHVVGIEYRIERLLWKCWSLVVVWSGKFWYIYGNVNYAIRHDSGSLLVFRMSITTFGKSFSTW